jgi:hypothetical protein
MLPERRRRPQHTPGVCGYWQMSPIATRFLAGGERLSLPAIISLER